MRIGEAWAEQGLARLVAALSRHRLMVACVTLSALLASTAFVELTPARYRSEARLLVDTAPASAVVSASDLVASQMQVLRSREVARRTIERHALAAPLAREVAAPAGFGLAEARAATVLDDALLAHWFGHLSLERDGQSPVVRIGFEARDPVLAARIANGIAETFIELQAQGLKSAASLPHGPARLVSRALPAQDPSFPQSVPVVALSTLFAFLAATGAALVQTQAPYRKPSPMRPFEGRLPQPLPPPQFVASQSIVALPEEDGPDPMLDLAQRISRSPRGEDAVQIVVTTAAGSASDPAINLGRALSHDHSVIMIDLVSQFSEAPGLDALLTGVATFDEAIRLDWAASRLHILTCGMQESRGTAGLEIILQALARTYDYVVLLAPALNEEQGTVELALKADVTVLACPDGASDPVSADGWRALKAAGVRIIHAYSADQSWVALGGAGGSLLSVQPRSIHLMSGMTGSTQPSPATT
jgi:capsular polysaccharide biosynthesis protein